MSDLSGKGPLKKTLTLPVDFLVTVCLWIYFSIINIIIFSPLYFAALFSSDRERSIQRVLNLSVRSFLGLLRLITPGLRYDIEPDVINIDSSIVVCNHISYLDPLFMIYLFKNQKTIVKHTFFKVPVFGAILDSAGYISSSLEGSRGGAMTRRVEELEGYIRSGGVLFVFPEGTRSRDGKLGHFNKSAFKIARRCNVPVHLLKINNTDRLYRPGRSLFNTCIDNTIEISLVRKFHFDYRDPDFSLSGFVEEVRETLSLSLFPD